MKATLSVILALLAGLVVGTWSVKADLRRAQKEVADLKEQLSRRPALRPSKLGGLATVLKIPEVDAIPRDSVAAPGAESPSEKDELRAESAALASGSNTNRLRRHRHGSNPETLRQKLETASNAWKVRSDVARAGFISNATTSEEQSVQFNVAMAAMNLRVSNNVRTWVDYIKEQQDMTPETGMRMMNELSASLVYAYDDLDRALPADWRAKAGSRFEVLDFINPEVIMPLIEIEGVFQKTDDADAAPNPVDHRAP